MVYTSGVIDTLNKIFSAVLVGGIKRDNANIAEKMNVYKVCMPRFISLFQSNIFKDEYAFMYSIIKDIRAKVFTMDQLNTIINNSYDLILNSPFIDIEKFATTVGDNQTTDDEKVEAFKEEIDELFDELSNNVVTEDEFNSSCEIYVQLFKDSYMLETSQNMTIIMSDNGFDDKQTGKRVRHLHGVNDAQRYYNDRNKRILELSDTNQIRSLVVDEAWFESEMADEERDDTDELVDTGLAEIDSVMGKFRRSNVLGVLGPPKGGKTKFSNYIVARALECGLNVAVWPLEGTDDEWSSMQTAYFIRKQSGIPIDSDSILNHKYENDDIRQLVRAAKLSLATDSHRGRLSYISGTAYVEDFTDVLQSHYDNENPFDVIVIDSLVNIMSLKHIDKTPRISEAYMKVKDFVANRLKVPALAVLPAQLKQTVVDELRKDPDGDIDVTAGGESAETIRTPDYVFGLFSSKQERDSGIMKIYSVASRHSRDFDNFACHCELGSCFFESKSELN